MFILQPKERQCRATWYDTSKHKKIYREHSTAAVSDDLIKDLNIKVGKIIKGTMIEGSFLLVTNISNKKADTVEITDVSNSGNRHIDLSLTSFEKISKKSVGVIKVNVRKI